MAVGLVYSQSICFPFLCYFCVNGPQRTLELVGRFTEEEPENELGRHLNIDECGMPCRQSAL